MLVCKEPWWRTTIVAVASNAALFENTWLICLLYNRWFWALCIRYYQLKFVFQCYWSVCTFEIVFAGVPCNGSHKDSESTAQNLLQRGKFKSTRTMYHGNCMVFFANTLNVNSVVHKYGKNMKVVCGPVWFIYNVQFGSFVQLSLYTTCPKPFF